MNKKKIYVINIYKMPYQRLMPKNKRQQQPHSLSLPNTTPRTDPVMVKGDMVISRNFTYKFRTY
tara:strand:+ start:7090 stop:7281 length:192 start_codon:yes stop_codon:yes gene_type:complete